jgi:hypothetical protein
MKQPWAWMSNPRHGIMIQNCAYLNIGKSGDDTKRNTFWNLYNGVMINSTSNDLANPEQINLYYNVFIYITGGVNVGNPDIGGSTIFDQPNGAAIFGINANPKHPINLVVYGNIAPTANVNFNACNKDIILDAINLYAIENIGVNNISGFMTINANNKSFEAYNNKFTNVVMGLYKNGAHKKFMALGNRITLVDNPNATGGYISTGISSLDYNNVSNVLPAQIHFNTITSSLLSDVVGIDLFNGNAHNISENKIYFDGINTTMGSGRPSIKGINLTNSAKNDIKQNGIWTVNDPTAFANNNSTAIMMHKSYANKINCNGLDYTKYGIYAIASNYTYSNQDINGNRLNNPHCNILLRRLADEGTLGDIGDNFSTPKWDGKNIFKSPIATIALNNVFRVSGCPSPSTNDQVVTDINAYFLNVNAIPSFSNNFSSTLPGCNNVITVQIGGSTNPLSCITSPLPMGPPPVAPLHTPPADYSYSAYNAEPHIITVDRAIAIAQDSNTYTQFIPGITKIDQRLAYDWLQTNPTIRAQYPILDSFYLQNFATELEQLRRVDEAINELNDSTIFADSILFADKWAFAMQLNQEIDASTIFAEKEQWINTQYLNMLQNGIVNIVAEDKTSITALANACPYLLGNGVFKARMLNAILNPGAGYDDIGICNNSGVYRGAGPSPLDEEEAMINGAKKINTTLFNIFPNPTSGQITIDYHMLPNQTGDVVICDLLGRDLQTIDLNNKAVRVTTTLNFKSGIYFVKYIVDNKLIETQKLIVE